MRLRTVVALLLGILLPIASPLGFSESFELLNYTPPPGWTAQATPEGMVYLGKEAAGGATAMIAIYMSRPGSPAVSGAFAAYWRTYVEKAAPGPPPEPGIVNDGDFALAAGTKQTTIGGLPVNATLVAVVGRGRVFGAMGIARGEAAIRATNAFFSSLRLNSGGPAGPPATTPPGPSSTSGPEIDFDVPPGYIARKEGANMILVPTNPNDRQTQCTYGISPPRPSRGSLDADAEAALLEIYPGWQRIDDRRRVMKGTSSDGWPYFWNAAELWQGPSASSQRASAMTMVLPAGAGRVHLIWGRGTPLCTFDDLSFVRFFFGIRPRGWTSDKGNALARDILGTWRWTNGYSSANAMMQYTFRPDGKFDLDTGSITQLGITETNSASTRGGQYTLQGTEIILTRKNGDRKSYRVRIFDELNFGGWKRVLYLLDETATPQASVEYYRVN